MNKLLCTLFVVCFIGHCLSKPAKDKTCGGNCSPSNNCDTCPCGTTRNVLSQSAVESLCRQNSDWSVDCCRCIAQKESSFNTNAMNQNSGGSLDVGLWQINDGNWPSCNGGNAPCTTSANYACAKKVFDWGGKTWKFWSSCHLCGNCCKAN